MLFSLSLSPFAYDYHAALRNLAALTVALLLPLTAANADNTENITILALGDSLTAGYGLPDGQGLVPQLNQWFEDNPSTPDQPITILNGGVSGDTSAGGLSRLEWSLTPETQALIVTLGGNDMLRGLPPSETRKNLTTILGKAQERGLPVLLIGLKAPGNFGPAYATEFDAIYPALAAEYQTLLVDSYFGLLDPTATDLTQLTGLMLPDGIHPNAEGIQIIAQNLGPKIRELATKVPR